MHADCTCLPVQDRAGVLYLEHAKLSVQSGKLYYRERDKKSPRCIPHSNLAILFAGKGAQLSSDVLAFLNAHHIYLVILGCANQPMARCLDTQASQKRFAGFITIANQPEYYADVMQDMTLGRCGLIRKTALNFAKKRFSDKAEAISKLSETLDKVDEKLSAPRTCDELEEVRVRLRKNIDLLVSIMAGIDKKEARGVFERTKPGSEAGYALTQSYLAQGRGLADGFARVVLSEIGVPPGFSIFALEPGRDDLMTCLTETVLQSLIIPAAFYHGMSGGSAEAFREDVFEAYAREEVLAVLVRNLTEILRKKFH